MSPLSDAVVLFILYYFASWWRIKEVKRRQYSFGDGSNGVASPMRHCTILCRIFGKNPTIMSFIIGFTQPVIASFVVV